MPGITLVVADRSKFGVIGDQGKSYQVDLVRVQEMATLRMGLKSLVNQNFYNHWEKRLDLRYAS